MTTSTFPSSIDEAKNAVEAILEPWELLCGFTDVGGSYVPDICCETKEDFMDHQDEYMDADTLVVNKRGGRIFHVPWYDEDLNRRIIRGKYIKLRDKPAYMNE